MSTAIQSAETVYILKLDGAEALILANTMKFWLNLEPQSDPETVRILDGIRNSLHEAGITEL